MKIMKAILTITCFLSMFIATAQWTTDTDANTAVAESGELDVLAKGTSDGQTYIYSLHLGFRESKISLPKLTD